MYYLTIKMIRLLTWLYRMVIHICIENLYMLKSVSTIRNTIDINTVVKFVTGNNFCQEMQLSLRNDNTWFNRLIFSDECTFYTLVEKLIDLM